MISSAMFIIAIPARCYEAGLYKAALDKLHRMLNYANLLQCNLLFFKFTTKIHKKIYCRMVVNKFYRTILITDVELKLE